ncbi:MAG: M23 family metallopeptidase [Gemmatimonadetes bacterium]|nr:M23 family metallopeptidase [Gemmatimonadota bacterium]
MELTGRPCARHLALFRRLREDPGNARVGEYGRVRNNGTKNHWGLDFAALRGQAVKAVDRGTVSAVGTSETYGNYVEIAHKNADGKAVSWSFYAHLDEPSGLIKGENVAAGQLVGTVGNTGNAESTPMHLHFEIRTKSMPDIGKDRRDPTSDVKPDNRP